MTDIQQIPLEDIVFSEDKIRDIDGQTINDLRASIKKHGVLQPILVRPVEESKFEVVFGHHRCIAAKSGGLKTIPAFIRQMTEKKALLLSISENIQRLELEPLKEGEVYSKILQKYYKNAMGKITINELKKLSKDIGKTILYIKGRIILFEKLSPELKNEIGKNLTVTSAIQLGKLPIENQLSVFNEIQIVKETLNKKHQIKTKAMFAGSIGGCHSKYCICSACGSVHEKGKNYEY